MSGELSIQFLPARQGDAIWITWGAGHQILVDMGTRATGKAIRKRLSEAGGEHRAFDLLVVTHIDTDHIGGVMSGLVEAKELAPPVTFADVWFNGWEHLHDRKVSRLEGMGVKDGEKLGAWLSTRPWNEKFRRGPVRRDATTFPVKKFPEGLTLTVLGPSKRRLVEQQSTWTKELHDALNPKRPRVRKTTLEGLGTGVEPVIDERKQLVSLAESETGIDGSAANATSICLLLEHGETRVLLTGDGLASDIATALGELAAQRTELLDEESSRVRLDLVKMPHHGSQNNVDRALVELITCRDWLFSSDGTIYKHPDPPAIARILAWGDPRPRLIFTEPTAFNLWWNRADWKSRLRYSVHYGTKKDGVTWPLPRA